MKTLITNQKIVTLSLIVISLSLLGINFLYLKGVDKNLNDSINKLPQVNEKQKAAFSSILPDITSNQQISESKARGKELAKVINSLPYTDMAKNITISYSPKTKLIIAGITAANDIKDYREKKFLLEQKLYEFGAENLCNLTLVWAPPFEIKQDLTPADVHTFGCSN